MDIKLAVILLTFGIGITNAVGINDGEISVTTENNVTDIYYKGIKVAEPKGHCKKNLCMTKCCPFGAEYHPASRKCVNTTQVFDPPLYDKYLRLQNDNASDLFYYKIGIIQCEDMVRFQASVFATRRNTKFVLRTDGKIFIESPPDIPPWFLVNSEHFCVDNFVDDEGVRKVDALFCYVTDEIDGKNNLLTATCMLISCVFILLTVGVYVWLPKLHNVHGRVLIAYLTCLFVGFLLLATIQLMLYYDTTPTEACQTFTFLVYFSLLSAFFWLNVMCYDIWRVFSGKREIRPQKLLIWSQMRSYALYAFGIPTILTILLISLEYSGLPQHPWLPLIRFQGCFMTGNTRLLYLYCPILILCIANIILFVLTAVKITQTRKETSVLSSRESSRSDQQNNTQTLWLYVKLFVLMGINWILEVISALYPSENWIYTDIYNVLIGFVIFIIFVCKRQIFQLLKERFRETRGFPGSQNTIWSRTTTTTRDETALNSSYAQ